MATPAVATFWSSSSYFGGDAHAMGPTHDVDRLAKFLPVVYDTLQRRGQLLRAIMFAPYDVSLEIVQLDTPHSDRYATVRIPFGVDRTALLETVALESAAHADALAPHGEALPRGGQRLAEHFGPPGIVHPQWCDDVLHYFISCWHLRTPLTAAVAEEIRLVNPLGALLRVVARNRTWWVALSFGHDLTYFGFDVYEIIAFDLPRADAAAEGIAVADTVDDVRLPSWARAAWSPT